MVPSKITPEEAARSKKILATLSQAVTDLQSGTLGVDAMRAYLEHRKVRVGASALASFTAALQSLYADGTLTAAQARQAMVALRQDVAGRYVASARLDAGPAAIIKVFKKVPADKLGSLERAYACVLEETRRLQIEERLSEAQRSAVQALRERVEAVGADGKPVDIKAHGAELVSIWLEGAEDVEGRGAAVAERLDSMRSKGELDVGRYTDVVAEIAAWLHAPRRKTMDASAREVELRQLLLVAGVPAEQAREMGKLVRGFVGTTLKARKGS